MSQPAVSRALARLRDVFGDPLFVRGAGGVIATPRALSLHNSMAGLLLELGTVIDAPAFDPATSNRLFRIATTDYGALAVLAPIIGRLLLGAPAIGIDIVPLTSRSFVDLGSADLDIALYSDDDPPIPLMSRPIFEESYVTLLRRHHPATSDVENGRLPMASFLAYSHVLVTVGGDRVGIVDAALASKGLSRSVAITLPYFSTAALMASQTDMLLTLPARVAHSLAAGMGLATVQPPLEIAGFGYRLLWHSRSDSDAGCQWLRGRLAELSG